MSVIRKKPFIQTLVEDLTEAQKASLLGVMNGSGSTEEATFGDLPEDAIAPVLFKFSEVDTKTGILIQSDNYTVLIAYHRFQDLLMFKINSNNTYEKINEYLDINELRNLLEDSGDVEFKGDISVANDSEVKVFENIVDKDGHKRFVEGEGTSLEMEGYTPSLCKWSLSGTHLMLVVEGGFANSVSTTGTTSLAKFYLPDWILAKIHPVWGGKMIETKIVSLIADDWSNQTVQIKVSKNTDGYINLETAAVTLTAARKFRVQFDYLIDNE